MIRCIACCVLALSPLFLEPAEAGSFSAFPGVSLSETKLSAEDLFRDTESAELIAAHVIASGRYRIDAFTSDGETMLSGYISPRTADRIVADLVDRDLLDFAVSEEIRDVIEGGTLTFVLPEFVSPAVSPHDVMDWSNSDVQMQMDVLMGQADAWAEAQMQSGILTAIFEVAIKILDYRLHKMECEESVEAWREVGKFKDSDGDGHSDTAEVDAGTNPFDPEDHPCFPTPWLWLSAGETLVVPVTDISPDQLEDAFLLTGSRAPLFSDYAVCPL